jgi:glycosyltransferase involved in cell wall biosynthesis
VRKEGKIKGRVCHLGKASSIHVQRWVNFFAEEGWEVHLVTFEPAKPKELHPKVIQHVIIPSPHKYVGFFTAALGVRKTLKKIKPDIIHAHSIPAYGIYAWVYFLSGKKIPFILTAWGYLHVETYKGLRRFLDKKALKKTDEITTLVAFMKDKLVSTYSLEPNKITVLPWGIDKTLFYKGYKKEVKQLKNKLNIPENHFVVISNREMNPYYGIEYIVEAIPYIVTKHPETIFIIRRCGGDPEYEKDLKLKADELGVSKNVRFQSEFLPYEEVPIWLNAADLSIMIPLTDQGPLSLFESMICGCIVIATDIQGNREYIRDGENGFLIPPKDQKIIAERINHCIEHPELKRKFYETNKVTIEDKFIWQKNSKKMEQIYFRLLEKYK